MFNHSDISECPSNPCHKNASCSNAGGNYTCQCYTGYTGNGITCRGIKSEWAVLLLLRDVGTNIL